MVSSKDKVEIGNSRLMGKIAVLGQIITRSEIKDVAGGSICTGGRGRAGKFHGDAARLETTVVEVRRDNAGAIGEGR
jgi:hypothetical protein